MLTGANVQITGMTAANIINSDQQYTNVTVWAAYSSRAVIDVRAAVRY